MNIPVLGEGLAVGAGKTTTRFGFFDASENMDAVTLTTQTPSTPEKFFGLTGNLVQDSINKGARWAVLGSPGLVVVEVDDEDNVTQRLRATNIEALNRKGGFDPVAEWGKQYPVIREAVEAGEFTLLTVNDGRLASQAGAELFAEDTDMVVADIVDGSGTGGDVVIRDTRFEQKLFHPFPGIWELGHLPDSLDHPTATPEQAISGLALDGRIDGRICDLDPSHPVFRVISRGIARLAVTLSLTAAPDLIVVSGGIGIEAQAQYRDAVRAELEWFAASTNPMAEQVEKTRMVFPEEGLADIYELYGAPGAMRSHLIARKISQLVRNAP